jgi:hypothetical protein
MVRSALVRFPDQPALQPPKPREARPRPGPEGRVSATRKKPRQPKFGALSGRAAGTYEMVP